jgi:uncharacterized Tic20 family protein
MSSEAPSPIPQPEELGARERDDAMGAYLMMFAALHLGLPIPLISLLASVIYHFVNARKSPFTRFHSLQALVSQIPVAVLTGIWTVWVIVILIDWFRLQLHGSYESFWWFTLITVVCTLTYSVYCIIAAVYAHKGRMFYFPLAGRWAYRRAFSPKTALTAPRNVPPKGL